MVVTAQSHDSALASAYKGWVLIITDNPQAVLPIKTQIEKLGFSITAFPAKDTLAHTPPTSPKAVLCYIQDEVKYLPNLVSEIKDRYPHNDIPIIGTLRDTNNIDADIFDSLLFSPAHPVQIANRINAMVRLAQMQTEIAHRIATLQDDFGIDYALSATSFDTPLRVLFIGKAAPEFMVIINALQDKNVEVIAAFTSFSAFDFLHEAPFDAVVINMLEGVEPGFTITETMRRNSRLFHTPTLFLTGKDFENTATAYQKGASDIIPFAATRDEISGRILELANYHRIQKKLKDEFSALGNEASMDSASGTYNSAFFLHHVNRINKANETDFSPTALMFVRICSTGPDSKASPVNSSNGFSYACDQVGQMIKNLVRMEDVVARLNTQNFVIAFPGQSKAHLNVITKRLNDVIENTAFDLSLQSNKDVKIRLDIRLTEVWPNQKSHSVIYDFIKDLASN